MIEYDWFDRLPAPTASELRGVLATCAEADAEAGFPRLELRGDGAGSQHLLVWLLPDDRWGGERTEDRTLAAYLRVDETEAAYVVRPELRSRGITTLLVEQLRSDGSELPKCTLWARGNHPAAARLAERFRIGVLRREWRLLAPLSDVPETPLRPTEDDVSGLWGPGRPPDNAEVLVADGGAVWFDTARTEPTEYGPAGRIHAVRGYPTRDLVLGAMGALRTAGLRVAALTLGVDDPIVHEVRRLGFRHDQTDVQYVLPFAQ